MGYYDRNTQRVNNTNVTGTWTGMTNDTTAGSTVNNRGIVRRGGTLTHSLLTSQAIAETSVPTGPIVYLTDTSNVALVNGEYTSRNVAFKAISGGGFAAMTAGFYVCRRVTTKLATVTNTTLRCAGSDYGGRRSIHKKEIFNYSMLTVWTFTASGATDVSPGPNYAVPTYTYSSYSSANVPSNAADTDFGQNSSTATNPASQSTNDVAARPTIANPGQLVYKGPKPNPVLDLYKARTQA